MPFQENVVLPAPHPQEDAPDDGEVVPVGRVQRHLGCRAAGKLVVGHRRFELDDGDRAPLLASLRHLLERAAGLYLSRRDDLQDVAHLALEDASWRPIERDLGLVARLYPQQRILLEAGRQGAIIDVDEHHRRPERRRHQVHSRTKRELCDESRGRRPDGRQLQIVLGVAKLCPQASDRRVHAVDLRLIGYARLLGAGNR